MIFAIILVCTRVVGDLYTWFLPLKTMLNNLRLRDIQCLAQEHTAYMGWNKDLNIDLYGSRVHTVMIFLLYKIRWYYWPQLGVLSDLCLLLPCFPLGHPLILSWCMTVSVWVWISAQPFTNVTLSQLFYLTVPVIFICKIGVLTASIL